MDHEFGVFRISNDKRPTTPSATYSEQMQGQNQKSIQKFDHSEWSPTNLLTSTICRTSSDIIKNQKSICKSKVVWFPIVRNMSIEIAACHSRHSSLSSLDDLSLGDPSLSISRTPSPFDSMSHSVTILATTSPEINALCKRPRVLTLDNISDLPSPPQPRSAKKFCAAEEATSTYFSSSSSGSWDVRDLDHSAWGDSVVCSSTSEWSSQDDTKYCLSPCTPTDRNLEDIAYQLGGISLHGNDSRIKKPTLHRRVSVDQLPTPAEISSPERMLDVIPTPRPVPRLRRHRRNTTQIVLQPTKTEIWFTYCLRICSRVICTFHFSFDSLEMRLHSRVFVYIISN